MSYTYTNGDLNKKYACLLISLKFHSMVHIINQQPTCSYYTWCEINTVCCICVSNTRMLAINSHSMES